MFNFRSTEISFRPNQYYLIGQWFNSCYVKSFSIFLQAMGNKFLLKLILIKDLLKFYRSMQYWKPGLPALQQGTHQHIPHTILPEMLFFRTLTKQRKNLCYPDLSGFFEEP